MDRHRATSSVQSPSLQGEGVCVVVRSEIGGGEFNARVDQFGTRIGELDEREGLRP